MKFKTNLFYLFIFSSIIFLSNCKNDDDESGGGPGTSSIYEIACCQVPPLFACIGGAKLYVPNAFSPNGDGINDTWKIYSHIGIAKIESLVVKGSDGEVVFENNDFIPNGFDQGWDGRINGSISDAVYSYTIVVRNNADEIGTFDGNVCIRSIKPLQCVVNEKQCTYGLQHDGNGGFNSSLSPMENCE